MSIYRKTEKLAKKFDAAYPADLPARLEWWCKALGIDRTKLLRIIGLSAKQAGQRKSKDLKEILENPEWKVNAELVEGALHRLLSLFQYDWHALAKRIHEPVDKLEVEEPSRVKRWNGEVPRLGYTPTGDTSELMIYRMAEGGPQLLSALRTYLARSRAVAGRAES